MTNPEISRVPVDYDERDGARDETIAHDNFDTLSFDNIKDRDDISDGYDSLITDDIKDRDDTSERDGYDSLITEDTKNRDSSESLIIDHNDRSADNDTKKSDLDSEDGEIYPGKPLLQVPEQDKLSGNTKKSDFVNTAMSPGDHLREARTQKKLSVQQVADQLFLDVRVIEGLEANKYEGLPPSIFIRGYLRNYAKVLELMPGELLEAFDKSIQGEEPASSSEFQPTFTEEKQVTSRDPWHSIGTIVVIVTLMALMALWKFYPNTEEANQPSADEPKPEISEESWTPPSDSPPMGTDTVEETLKPEETSDPGELDQSTPPAEQQIPEDPIVRETTTLTETPSSGQTMRVHFKEDVWMTITDSSGEKLFAGTAKAGKVLDLEGKPPFYLQTMRIGLEIEYQGETNELKTYPKQQGQKSVFVVGSDE